MKILFIHNFYSDLTGEDLAVNETLEVLKRQTDIECVEYFKYSAGFKKLSAARKIASWFRANVVPRVPRDFTRLLDRERPVAAFVHNLIPLVNPRILKELRRRGIPVLTAIHNFRVLCPKGTAYLRGKFCARCFERSVCFSVLFNCLGDFRYSVIYALRVVRQKYYFRFTDVLVAPSRAVKEIYEKYFPQKRIVVLKEYVQMPLAGEIAPEGGKETVIFAGRITEEKGVSLVLEAARALPRLPFKICGDGPKLEFYKREASRAGIRNVEFLGLVDRVRLFALIRGARVLVVPSLWQEVFGRVTREAMLLKTVVIASCLGASPELVEHGRTGFLFDPCQPDACTDLIRNVWEDTVLCSRVAEEAYRNAVTENDAALSELLDLVRGVAGR